MDPKTEVKAGLAGAFLAVVSGGSLNSTAFESCEAHCHSPSENVSSGVYLNGTWRAGNANAVTLPNTPPSAEPSDDEQDDLLETREEPHGLPAGEGICFNRCSGCVSCVQAPNQPRAIFGQD
eukprot:GHVP01033876.1.p1 GENE.GHVP01033876.1~~GHVP01033876.1.p1  ORF type:complete len:129 (+),score=21.03 GHVP01033876.1:24-389(+)